MPENLSDVYDDDTIGVWKSENIFHLRLWDRGVEVVFTSGEWVDFLSSIKTMFHKEGEQ